MYTGTNPSALRSRKEITQAFLRLLEATPLEQITIKQIMDSTDLTRQTFYQIFQSKDEILEHYLDEVFDQFISGAQQQTITNLCDAAMLFFSFFDKHQETLRLFINNGKSHILQQKCKEYLQTEQYVHYELSGVHNEQEKQFAATFVVCGMVGMLEQWIHQQPDSIHAEALAHLVCRITNVEA